MDNAERLVKGWFVLGKGAAEREWEVTVKPSAIAVTALVGAAPIVWVVVVGIGVNGYIVHVTAAVEDLLCAVPVVVVDVEHNYAARLGQHVRRKCRIVEVAVAAISASR